MADERDPKASEYDEPIAIPLDPQVALRALLQVDPDSTPVAAPQGDQESDDDR
jgi:hypothetical protein